MARALAAARSAHLIGKKPRNRLVNGSFLISQSLGFAAVTTGNNAGQDIWIADQWVANNQNMGTWTLQNIHVEPGRGSNRVRMTITGTDTIAAATDRLILSQSIEDRRMIDLNWGTLAAKDVVLRFVFKGPAGTYSARISNGNSGAPQTYVSNFTIPAGRANVDTVVEIPISGPKSGNWATQSNGNIGLSLTIALGVGTEYRTAVTDAWTTEWNKMGTAANKTTFTNGEVYEIGEVGLYEGRVAPPYELPWFDDELRDCQRYFCKTMHSANALGTGDWGGTMTNGTFGSLVPVNFVWPVEMRQTPSVTAYSPTGAINMWRYNGVDTQLGGWVVQGNGTRGCSLYMTGGTDNVLVFGHLTASARL